jgi:two-component system NtrC family sensor kinase
VVQDVLDLLENRAKELNVQLVSRLTPNLPIVQVDPEGLNRAVLNIVGNAIDAVEDRKQPQVQVSTLLDPEPGWMRVEVLDNGKGISPELLEDIFRPFVSTKGSKGTGLGLAVSRKILREHGGDIVVQSQLGKGSKFILRVPIRSPFGHDSSFSQPELDMPPSDTIAS